MVKALIALGQLVRTVPLFEVAGSAAITVGVGLEAGLSWALIVAGGLLLLKAFDLALEAGRTDDERR